ncbi:hypothetical protein CFOL_v3_32526 [Cephalotus follicularis]|uniref:Uncharacterized protein n=1 Tax=Cephalotus follicularis TaxID=3775 RepID=A0A1Q3D9A7_CEPFO|nr:hypothetical protein CFOL_v3_32526 [Cephalotus follicularis]
MSELHYDEPLQLTDNWQDNYGSGYRNNRDYWQARRAFLNSYHLTEENCFRHKIKRSVKELKDAAKGVVLEIRKGLSKRKIGIRVFMFTFHLPSLLIFPSIDCFVPWLSKRELSTILTLCLTDMVDQHISETKKQCSVTLNTFLQIS